MSLQSSKTLSPLPSEMKNGIIVHSIMGICSLLSCGLLFTYISYIMYKSRRGRADEARQALARERRTSILDLTFVGRSMKQFDPELMNDRKESESQGVPVTTAPDSTPFLTLIYHLLVADMLQALSVVLNTAWWASDGIYVPSTTCSAQAIFVVLGSLSQSVFLTAISISTVLTITCGVKMSRKATMVTVVLSWLFTFAIIFATAGFAATTIPDREANDGWFFARTANICWIHPKYVLKGFFLQNFWIILAICIAFICYTCIIISTIWNRQSWRHLPPASRNRDGLPEPSGHHPAFIVYPVIYIITTGPITLTGALSIMGIFVNASYFSLASTLASMSGLLDAILWSTTILFSSAKALDESGLSKYDFRRTPGGQRYGNFVWIEGASTRPEERDKNSGHRKWWGLTGGDGLGRSGWRSRSGSADITTGDARAIQMDTVTTVTTTVEAEAVASPSSPSLEIHK